jgi:hypothetical protein
VLPSHRLVPLFVWGILHTEASQEKRKEASPILSFHFCYIDGVLSLNNSTFDDCVDRIYSIELGIMDATDTARFVWYLDLHIEIDSEGRLRTNLRKRRLFFNFPIVNFPFICSNIPAAPEYGVYLSQLIQYFRASGSYHDFFDKTLLLTRKQSFLVVKLKLSHRKFYGQHHDWLTVTEYLCHKWPRICSVCRNHKPALSSFMTCHRFCDNSEAKTALPSGSLDVTPVNSMFPFAQPLVFCVLFCISFLSFCVLSISQWNVYPSIYVF